MLKIKEITKDGKYLRIIIKKPHLISVKKFMNKNHLLFENDDWFNFSWCLTINGDIQLDFILSNFDDIKPYINLYKIKE